jgi:hypothetical protein
VEVGLDIAGVAEWLGGRVGGVISARGGGGEMGREVLIARRVIRGGWVY